MIIVLEGGDAVGKSTLARFLRDNYGARMFHQTYRWLSKMFVYHTAAVRHACRLSAQGHLVVLDRCWESEAIYADVFRGGTPWPQAGRFLDRVLLKHGALTVLCLPPGIQEHIARHAANRDPDHPYDDTKFREVSERYLNLAWGDPNHSPLPRYQNDSRVCGKKFGTYVDLLTQWGGVLGTMNRLDRASYVIEKHGDELNRTCNRLLSQARWLEAHQPPAALEFNYQNWGGSPVMAKYVVVGDTTNAKGKNPSWPFFEYANSSLYLAEHLHLLGIPEQDLLWFNGNDDTTAAEWLVADKPHTSKLPTICLGGKAYAAAIKLGFKDLRPVAHPSYFKRFQSAYPERYTAELRRAFSHE